MLSIKVICQGFKVSEYPFKQNENTLEKHKSAII